MRYIYRDVARDSNGVILRSATVNVYLAETTTAATIYTSSTSTTGVNSVTTDATDGSFTFYVDAFDYGSYQKFKFVLSKPSLSDDTFTADNISVSEVVNGTYTISTSKTFSLPVFIPKGVLFAKSGSGAITFSAATEIGPYQVFDSTFTSGIIFSAGSVESIVPEWWGTTVAAFNSSLVALASSGGNYRMRGTYSFSSQVTLTITSPVNINIDAYGSTITTSGAISAFKVIGSYTPHTTTISGMFIDHRGNATATAGIEVSGTAHVSLKSCVVEANGVGASYSGYWIHENGSTNGALWTNLDRCTVRKRSGSDVGDITYGIMIQGQSNATSITNCSLSTGATGDCIHMKTENGNAAISNGCLIHGNHFETFGIAINVVADATSYLTGMRITDNRAEDGTTFLQLSGSSVGSVVPTYLSGNYLISSVTNYIVNASGALVNSFDMSSTPAIRAHIVCNTGYIIESFDATIPVAAFRQGNVGKGIEIQNSSGTTLGQLKYAASGKFVLQANSGSGVNLYSLEHKGISSTTTRAENLRGTATFAGAATKAVSFAVAEPDATYFLALSCSAQEIISTSSKGTAGFTLTSSNATSTAVVDWILIR